MNRNRSFVEPRYFRSWTWRQKILRGFITRHFDNVTYHYRRQKSTTALTIWRRLRTSLMRCRSSLHTSKFSWNSVPFSIHFRKFTSRTRKLMLPFLKLKLLFLKLTLHFLKLIVHSLKRTFLLLKLNWHLAWLFLTLFLAGMLHLGDVRTFIVFLSGTNGLRLAKVKWEGLLRLTWPTTTNNQIFLP